MSVLNAKEFLKDVLDFADSHNADVIDRLIRKTTLDLHGKIQTRTPVDTGRARAGWMASTGYCLGTINNNVEYIGALENGHSKQAPSGMVKISVEEAIQDIHGFEF